MDGLLIFKNIHLSCWKKKQQFGNLLFSLRQSAFNGKENSAFSLCDLQKGNLNNNNNNKRENSDKTHVVPPCWAHILCGLSAQSQTAGRFLCSSSRTLLRASQFHGQEVLDLDSLDSSRLFFFTGDRHYKRFQKNIFAHRFGSCATFAKRMTKLAQNPLKWHLRPRLSLRSGEQTVGGTQKVTLELKSIGRSVSGWVGVTVGGAHRRRLILPSLASWWMTCVSKSALWTPVFLKAPA